MSPRGEAPTIALTGLGAVTPVGLSMPTTCAALRAGIARMLPLEGWDDAGPAPPEDLVVGRVPLEWIRGDVRTEWPGHERWNLKPPKPHLLVSPDGVRLPELAIPAAEEAWEDAGAPGGRLGLYLGLDEGESASAVADALASALGLRFEVQRVDRLGRAAALAAVHRAARHLRERRVDVALVGGVDSRIRRAAIARLEAAGLLRSESNPHGVIPGEAAVFLVLEADVEARRARAWIEGSAVAEEPTAATGEPNRGEGLTQALRRARAGARPHASRPLIVCDLNGERYRTIEWSLASVRALGDLHRADETPSWAQLWHPADCTGDTGAASGTLDLGWAATAMGRSGGGNFRHGRAIVWGASDGALRASVLLAHERED